jgi:hypothetical protein
LLFLIFVEHFGDHGRVEIVNFRGRRILTHGHMSDANRTFFHILLQRVDILEYGEQTLGGYFTLECRAAGWQPALALVTGTSLAPPHQCHRRV